MELNYFLGFIERGQNVDITLEDSSIKLYSLTLTLQMVSALLFFCTYDFGKEEKDFLIKCSLFREFETQSYKRLVANIFPFLFF